MRVKADVPDRCPDNGETTGFRCKNINQVGALSYVAEQTFDRIGGLNISVHGGRKRINEVGSQRVASPIDSEERFSKVVTL
jgi:hypothetical protein